MGELLQTLGWRQNLGSDSLCTWLGNGEFSRAADVAADVIEKASVRVSIAKEIILIKHNDKLKGTEDELESQHKTEIKVCFNTRHETRGRRERSSTKVEV